MPESAGNGTNADITQYNDLWFDALQKACQAEGKYTGILTQWQPFPRKDLDRLVVKGRRVYYNPDLPPAVLAAELIHLTHHLVQHHKERLDPEQYPNAKLRRIAACLETVHALQDDLERQGLEWAEGTDLREQYPLPRRMTAEEIYKYLDETLSEQEKQDDQQQQKEQGDPNDDLQDDSVHQQGNGQQQDGQQQDGQQQDGQQQGGQQQGGQQQGGQQQGGQQQGGQQQGGQQQGGQQQGGQQQGGQQQGGQQQGGQQQGGQQQGGQQQGGQQQGGQQQGGQQQGGQQQGGQQQGDQQQGQGQQQGNGQPIPDPNKVDDGVCRLEDYDFDKDMEEQATGTGQDGEGKDGEGEEGDGLGEGEGEGQGEGEGKGKGDGDGDGKGKGDPDSSGLKPGSDDASIQRLPTEEARRRQIILNIAKKIMGGSSREDFALRPRPSPSSPSRRGKEMFLSKLQQEKEELGILIDVSGSITDEMLKLFFGIIDELRHREQHIKIATGDVKVHEVGGTEIMKKPVTGRGGTEFDHVIPEAYQKLRKPKRFLVITDGETKWPEHLPVKNTTILIVNESDKFNAPGHRYGEPNGGTSTYPPSYPVPEALFPHVIWIRPGDLKAPDIKKELGITPKGAQPTPPARDFGGDWW